MFSHSDIWRGIDRLALSSGYSASGLAKKAGLDPTSFNKSKRLSPDGKPRWPSTESLSKILSVTDSTMSDFISLIDSDAEGEQSGLNNAHQIPVLGFAQAGQEGYFDEDGYPAGDAWDTIPFPSVPGHKSETTYALEVSGDSMLPLYRDGDYIILSPSTSIRKGDRIVVKTTSNEVMAKELLRQTSSRIELKSLNEHYPDRDVRLDELQWIARIIWVSQ